MTSTRKRFVLVLAARNLKSLSLLTILSKQVRSFYELVLLFLRQFFRPFYLVVCSRRLGKFHSPNKYLYICRDEIRVVDFFLLWSLSEANYGECHGTAVVIILFYRNSFFVRGCIDRWSSSVCRVIVSVDRTILVWIVPRLDNVSLR